MSSTAANVGFFEGTEKLLEVWFAGAEDKTQGLRKVPRSAWDRMLDMCKCTIISTTSNDDMDAYVLSESSMFVSSQRIILKTCGTTALLMAIPVLLDVAKQYCGFTEVVDLFYSRKNFLHPEKQQGVHSCFDDEVNYLDGYFSGSGYILGSINRDVWYLYTLAKPDPVPQPDQTFEVLMSDLPESTMRVFYKDGTFVSNDDTTKRAGIDTIIPGAICDAAVFDPCGYSVNGLLGDTYFTIHVTPQPECSYVSFETNHLVASYNDILDKLLTMFRPGKIMMTVFANESALCSSADGAVCRDILDKHGFARGDKMGLTLTNYNLSFSHWKHTSMDNMNKKERNIST